MTGAPAVELLRDRLAVVLSLVLDRLGVHLAVLLPRAHLLELHWVQRLLPVRELDVLSARAERHAGRLLHAHLTSRLPLNIRLREEVRHLRRVALTRADGALARRRA